MLDNLLDLILGKPKEKAKPAPVCYLFIGEHQCIGGYETIALAFSAIKFEETPDCRITSDMQGEDVLYRWEERREYLTCGCEYKRYGWHNGNYFVSPYHEQRINYCGDDELHQPVYPQIPSGRSPQWYMFATGFPTGSLLGFKPKPSASAASDNNNGDPLS